MKTAVDIGRIAKVGKFALNKTSHIVLEYISPTRCVSCEAAGNSICRSCLLNLGELPPLVCSGCGAISQAGQTCGLCQKLQAPIDQLVSAFLYENHHFHRALAACKEKGDRDVMPYLAARLARRLQALSATTINDLAREWKDFIVVPVPATRRRQIERGFNQAELLAQCIGRLLHLPVRTNILRRLEPNARVGDQQKELSILDRRSKLAGTYQLHAPASPMPKNILLCDDVATTLATQETCAQILRDAGAQCIVGAVLAHAQ